MTTSEKYLSEKKTAQQSKSGDVVKNKGTVKAETPKALLIEFKPGLEDWIPKSMIKSQYSSQEGAVQDFTIEAWVLKKRGISN